MGHCAIVRGKDDGKYRTINLLLTLYLGLNWSYRNWEMMEVLPTFALPITNTLYLVLVTRERLTKKS